MKPLILGTVSAVALATGSAQAGESFDWTGPYVGGNVGVGILGGTMSASGGFGPSSQGMSDAGVTFGGQLGWSFRNGDFVFGAEGGFNFLDLGDNLDHFTGKATVNVRADYDWFASLRARAGILVDPSILIYGTGGIAFIESNLKVTNPPFTTASDTDVLMGWAAGAGVEYAFSNSVSARIEYLYANFEKHTVGPVPGGFSPTGSAEPEIHAVRIGVSWRFCTDGMC